MSAHVFSGLYDEIKTEIISRMPAKSVGRLRCLSKKWLSILSSPKFIDLHLSRKTHEQSLIFTTPFPSYSLRIINPPIENPIVSKKIVELGYEMWIGVLGSCNGLVVLLSITKEIFLVNPITFEKLNTNLPRYTRSMLLHGLGYDSSARDYKILMISNSLDPSTSTSVDLYSVKSGAWKSVVYSRFEFVIRSCNCDPRGVYANGSIHWCDYLQRGNTNLGKILAFNLTTEEFHIVGTPNLDVTGNNLKLFAHEGRLCAISSLLEMRIDKLVVWEYGMVNSWTKVGSISINYGYGHMIMNHIMLHPFCFSRDKDILLVMTSQNMTVVNTHEGTMKKVDFDGVRAFNRGASFVGSLVSIKDI